MTEVEKARAAWADARRVRQETKAARDSELNGVRARWAKHLDDADTAVLRARTALLDAESAATPDHEWEGRTVTQSRPVRDSFGRTRGYALKVRGVVFTYRHGADLGRGGPYQPVAGEPLVRLLKKDGTPGAKVERLLAPRYDLTKPAVARWVLDGSATS